MVTHPNRSKREAALREAARGMDWKIHTPNLLTEILKNRGTETLRTPINIFGKMLGAVAERAAEINDPRLNVLMLRLTLYDVADPEKHSISEITDAFNSQFRALAKMEEVL